MNEHEEFQELLPMAAAGLLAPEEAAAVDRHAAICPACARELSVLLLYARGLREMPAPAVPAGLLQRTQARVMQAEEIAAERRWNGPLLGVLAVFSWVSGTVFWLLARWLTGGIWVVLGVNLVDGGTWSLLSIILIWTTAGAAALTLGRRGERAREVL